MSEQVVALPRPRVVAASSIAFAAGAIAAGAMRIAILLRYRIDSDETQHLHVAWGWTHGLVQYRDLFDNHMPLFHILSAPLLLAAGERPEALIAGRMAMLPLFAIIAALTYHIASSVYEHTAAVWAMAIGVLTPLFFLCSVEFRPDVLWAACWLAMLDVLIVQPLTPRRCAAAGLLLGIAAAISAKTALLAVSLAIAALVTFVLMRDVAVPAREHVKRVTSFTAAALLPPSIIAACFAAIGAWKPFLNCTITHNLVASEHPHRMIFIVPSIAIMAAVVRRIARQEIADDLRRRRVFLFLAAASYGALLISFWPIIEAEHWLPFYPAIAAGAVPLLLPSTEKRSSRITIAIVALELFSILRLSTPWTNQIVPTLKAIDETARLTAPGDYVVDLKGELVFRRRTTYSVFEKITKKAILTGSLPDTIAADVLRTQTMVAVPDNDSFPRIGRAFLQRNFVDVGSLRVAGKIVSGDQAIRIEIPGGYSVVSARGAFNGTVDGARYVGPRFLDAGRHVIHSDSPDELNAVIWERASALGLSPFRVVGSETKRSALQSGT